MELIYFFVFDLFSYSAVCTVIIKLNSKKILVVTFKKYKVNKSVLEYCLFRPVLLIYSVLIFFSEQFDQA